MLLYFLVLFALLFNWTRMHIYMQRCILRKSYLDIFNVYFSLLVFFLTANTVCHLYVGLDLKTQQEQQPQPNTSNRFFS